MKIVFALVLLFNSTLTIAQSKFSPQECYSRCTTSAAEEPFSMPEKVTAALKAIQEKKKSESDPAKLKQLEKMEEEELENLKDAMERMCSKICGY
ncbi:hypothetical protein KW842_17180 [Duganella sp. sic0402]|uniref:hypothetical protein n=1 Tax=Duganella sp. sic0402 TaxID=2854786 RepID=UPI001C481E05|nr:hypothetical protein [Duganella sp. sic0402]MBV7537503.1 hypothetical protein [Duganella sp. sic0402]